MCKYANLGAQWNNYLTYYQLFFSLPLVAQSPLQASEIRLPRTKSSLLYVTQLSHCALIELSHLHSYLPTNFVDRE